MNGHSFIVIVLTSYLSVLSATWKNTILLNRMQWCTIFSKCCLKGKHYTILSGHNEKLKPLCSLVLSSFSLRWTLKLSWDSARSDIVLHVLKNVLITLDASATAEKLKSFSGAITLNSHQRGEMENSSVKTVGDNPRETVLLWLPQISTEKMETF